MADAATGATSKEHRTFARSLPALSMMQYVVLHLRVRPVVFSPPVEMVGCASTCHTLCLESESVNAVLE